MEQFHVPGIAVGIWNQGKEELHGWGVTNVDHPLTVDGDTLFQIASITKTITATVIMRLVDQGKVDLAAPVRRYWTRRSFSLSSSTMVPKA